MFRQTIQLTGNLGCRARLASRAFTWRRNVVLRSWQEIFRSRGVLAFELARDNKVFANVSFEERRDVAYAAVDETRRGKQKKKEKNDLFTSSQQSRFDSFRFVSFRQNTVAPPRWYVIREPS